ncbi:MAG: hypothetical protein ACRDD1_19860 [Planctomycetia bacterium]
MTTRRTWLGRATTVLFGATAVGCGGIPSTSFSDVNRPLAETMLGGVKKKDLGVMMRSMQQADQRVAASKMRGEEYRVLKYANEEAKASRWENAEAALTASVANR